MTATIDVIVVGGGAAGLTAGLFTARRGLQTLIVTEDIGGQAALTNRIQNYPGLGPIDGFALMATFHAQAEAAGATTVMTRVQAIAQEANDFVVTAGNQIYRAPVVILACGLTHRRLNVPGEAELTGHGLSYCATCDAPLFKGKAVAVIGGGNSAMEAALLLAQYCPAVTIVTINGELRGELPLVEKITATPHITILTGASTTAIQGRDRVTGLTVSVNDVERWLEVGGVFVEIGYVVDPTLGAGFVDRDGQHQIVIHPLDNSTSVPGLFAAGDITTIAQKQVVVSAGEGAKAAIGAAQYIARLRGRPATNIDWSHSGGHRSPRPELPHLPTSQKI